MPRNYGLKSASPLRLVEHRPMEPHEAPIYRRPTQFVVEPKEPRRRRCMTCCLLMAIAVLSLIGFWVWVYKAARMLWPLV
jgi:hypothetical protein